MLKKMHFFLSAIIAIVAFCLHPLPSYGAVSKTVHIEWSYDTSLPNLAGYRIYLNGTQVADIPDPTVQAADITLLLENTDTITMTAYDTAGQESAQSAPYPIPADIANNSSPIADISVDVTNGENPLPVTCDGGGSSDPDGSIISYVWDFGDGSTANGDYLTHTYQNAGNYTVTLTVTDDQGASDTATTTINVTQALVAGNLLPLAEIVTDQTAGDAPLTVSFDGSWSDDPDGTISSYYWSFGDGQAASGVNVVHTFTTPGDYTVSLTVTDNNGGQSSAETVISVTSSQPLNPPQIVSASQIGVIFNGDWYLDINGNGKWDGEPIDMKIALFGKTNSVPVMGDWNGDGIREAGIFRNGTWFLDLNGNGIYDGGKVDARFTWGCQPGDIPVTGDWNGDGITETGIYRNGEWFLDLNGNGVFEGGSVDVRFTFGGQPGDIPVTGDWNGDGITETGIFRNGTWFLDLNGNGIFEGGKVDSRFTFGGQPGDIPVTGDWNGDGITEAGIFRNGTWFLDLNGNGVFDGSPTDASYTFGVAGDTPVVGNW